MHGPGIRKIGTSLAVAALAILSGCGDNLREQADSGRPSAVAQDTNVATGVTADISKCSRYPALC